MNKKGDLTDSLSFVIVITILIIGFFCISFTVPYITNGLRTAGLNNSAQGSHAIDKLQDFGLNGIQKGVYFVFIGLCISILISSFFVDTHPLWLFLYIIFLVIAVIIAAYLGNVYYTMTINSTFNGFTQNYYTMIMSNIVLITIVISCLSFVIIFGKWALYGGANGGRF